MEPCEIKVAMIDPSGFTMQYDNALCNALSNHGCKVYFFTSKYLYGDLNYQIKYQNIESFYNFTNWLYKDKTSGFLRIVVKGLEHVFNMYNLTRVLKKVKPDIIHFQWIPFPLCDGFFLTFFKKISPVILTVHDATPYHDAPSSKIQLLYFSSIGKNYDHLITHTKSSLEILVNKLKIPEEKISIVPHGIFYHYRKNLALDKPVKNNNCFIVFFGTIKPYKGLDVLIQAYAKLSENNRKKYKLLIAGIPKMDVGPLKTMAENLGVADNIYWHLEFIPEEKVGEILSKAAVFVLPYKKFEAQSGSLMAMLPFCKPIVATNMASFKEILKDGIHGRLVEPNDPFSFASALEDILSDEQKRAQMERAIEILMADSLRWDESAQRTIFIYKRLLLCKRSRRC